MNVKSCEKTEKSQVELLVEVGPEEFEAALEKAYRKLRRRFRVPGFRPGKAPRKIIESRYGVEVFFEDAINEAAPAAYDAAIAESSRLTDDKTALGDWAMAELNDKINLS